MTSITSDTMSPSIAPAESGTLAIDRPAPGRQEIRFDSFHRAVLDGPSRRELVGDPDHESALTGYLDGLLSPSIRLISVDVFDTVLLRHPVSELGRFVGIATRQAEALAGLAYEGQPTAIDLLVARLQATRASYRLSEPRQGAREGSILQIHRTVERTLGLRRGSHQALIDHELAFEATVTYRNTPLCRWLEERRAAGTELVLLSDMYLHGEHIRRLLDTHDILDGVEVVSSADHKVNKHSGSAYPALLESRQLGADELLHLGDNLRSDYQLPRRLGIRSGHLPIPRAELAAIDEDEARTLTELQVLGHDVGRWI